MSFHSLCACCWGLLGPIRLKMLLVSGISSLLFGMYSIMRTVYLLTSHLTDVASKWVRSGIAIIQAGIACDIGSRVVGSQDGRTAFDYLPLRSR